jgi:hypothetical protein
LADSSQKRQRLKIFRSVFLVKYKQSPNAPFAYGLSSSLVRKYGFLGDFFTAIIENAKLIFLMKTVFNPPPLIALTKNKIKMQHSKFSGIFPLIDRQAMRKNFSVC